jgi:peptide chain release factor subunit 1
MDTGKFVYGVHDTMKSLEAGALETIMCFEGLEYQRVIMKNKDTEALTTTYLKPE